MLKNAVGSSPEFPPWNHRQVVYRKRLGAVV